MSVVLLILFVMPRTNVFGYYLSDLTLPKESHGESKSDHEECLASRRYFYGNQCWDLLTRGPCDEGQWLVRSDRGGGGSGQQAKCETRKCDDSDFYWPSDGFCYSAETARRVALCPQPHTELVVDEYGNGRCGCRRDDQVTYVRVLAGDEDGDDEDSLPCHPLYTRAVCPEGQVVAPVERGYGHCAEDTCAPKRDQDELNLLRMRSTSTRLRQQSYKHPQEHHRDQQKLTIIVPWIDGKCYELGTQGPCAEKEQLAVLRDLILPVCIQSAVGLSIVEPNCYYRNHTGHCQNETVRVEKSPTIVERLRQQLKAGNRKKTRP